MRHDWSLQILLAAEVTFGVLFVRSLLRYLRRRDPLQRDIAVVFVPPALLFAVNFIDLVTDLPAGARLVSTVVLLAQPYLTVRLATRLRSVPRWLNATVLLTYLFALAAVVLAGVPMPPPVLLVAVAAFLTGEAIAAGLLLGKARTRTGANRARLR